MKPTAMADMLAAQAGILDKAGAGGVGAARDLERLARYLAAAKGASVKAALKLLPQGASPGPGLRPVVAILEGMRAMQRAVSEKSAAIGDLDALIAALSAEGAASVEERIAAWQAAARSPARQQAKPKAKSGAGADKGVVTRHAEAIRAAKTPEAALDAVAALAKDKSVRVAELRALISALDLAAPGAKESKAKLIERLRWPHLSRITDRDKKAAIEAKGTL